MPLPDYASYRRQLRSFRISEALSFAIDGESRQRSRDALLPSLAMALGRTPGRESFERVDEFALETAVSIALAYVDEAPEDRYAIALMSAELLVTDGQFARIRHLAVLFRSVANLLRAERPILAAEAEAIARIVANEFEPASETLARVLGLRGQVERVDSSQLPDVIGAGALYTWLQVWLDVDNEGPLGPDDPYELFGSALDLATASDDGLLFARLQFHLALAKSAHAASTVQVLNASNDLQGAAYLKYLRRRGIRTLFVPQIKAIEGGALKHGSKLVALPTSSGKTFLAELRIAATLFPTPGARALYIAPYRLLSRQVERDLGAGLAFLDISVRDLGGTFDSELGRAGLDRTGVEARVLVLTPERLDALMRSTTATGPQGDAARALLDSVSLLVFDEAQLIGRSGRGAKFEFILARFRHAWPSVEILGLAASTYSVKRLGRWLGDHEPVMGGRRPAGTLEILWQTTGELIQRSGRQASRVAEITRGKTALEDAVRIVLQLAPEQRPVLIVEPKRDYCESLALKLQSAAPRQGVEWREQLGARKTARLDSAAEEVRATLGDAHPLARWISNGIAYHHAGLPTNLLRIIEELARDRLLRFLASTTTVAEGADLPFRTIVIPHQNFDGSASRRLDRDLYQNMIGRAGRASYAVEGLVLILQSGSAAMKDIVKDDLWSERDPVEVASALSRVTSQPADADAYSSYRDIQSQVLAWVSAGTPTTFVGSSGAVEVADPQGQIEGMVDRLYAAADGGPGRASVRRLVSGMLEELSREDLVRAASPYQATAWGVRVGMTGLSLISTRRILSQLSDGRDAWLRDLHATARLDVRMARLLARIALESEEVLIETLWVRRTAKSPFEKLQMLGGIWSTSSELPESNINFRADIDLISSWMLGVSYEQMATLAPVSKRGLFADGDAASRASDAAEYAGRISYPASWVISSLRHIADIQLPAWLGDAVELGVDSDAAVQLVREVGLVRTSAVRLVALIDTDWDILIERLGEFSRQELVVLGLTQPEIQRLLSFIDR